jgi:hypothetical protein
LRLKVMVGDAVVDEEPDELAPPPQAARIAVRKHRNRP